MAAVILAVLALTLQFPEGTHSAQTPWELASTSAFALSATITWNGATASTRVYIAHGGADCSVLSSVIDEGSGASGALHFTLVPGTPYEIFACNDAAASSTQFTLLAAGAQGYTLFLAIGAGIFAIAGLAVLLTGREPRRRFVPRRPRHREFD